MTTEGTHGRYRWAANGSLSGWWHWQCTCGEGSGEDYPSEIAAAQAAEEHARKATGER